MNLWPLWDFSEKDQSLMVTSGRRLVLLTQSSPKSLSCMFFACVCVFLTYMPFLKCSTTDGLTTDKKFLKERPYVQVGAGSGKRIGSEMSSEQRE